MLLSPAARQRATCRHCVAPEIEGQEIVLSVSPPVLKALHRVFDHLVAICQENYDGESRNACDARAQQPGRPHDYAVGGKRLAAAANRPASADDRARGGDALQAAGVGKVDGIAAGVGIRLAGERSERVAGKKLRRGRVIVAGTHGDQAALRRWR